MGSPSSSEEDVAVQATSYSSVWSCVMLDQTCIALKHELTGSFNVSKLEHEDSECEIMEGNRL